MSQEVEGRKLNMLVRNMGEPILLKDVEICGFAMTAALPGQMCTVRTRLTLTSDDPLFHRLAKNLNGVLDHHLQQVGSAINMHRVELALLVIKPNKTAELWVDAAAVSMRCIMKRDIEGGRMVFNSDIADVTGMYFPNVKLDAADKVVCLFREGWRFGMFCDFNPEGNLDAEALAKDLGMLYRNLKYKELYDALGNQEFLSQIVTTGWFPFSEIINGEFNDLLNHIEAQFELNDIEKNILAKFDEQRLDRILRRWLARTHFSTKEALLKTAIESFKKGEPISTIKIVLTEIEGILNEAHRTEFGEGAKLKALLEFAVDCAEKKAGERDTLLFPAAFTHYLATYTFGNFDPTKHDGTAGSRHAVGHGAAKTETYTMTRALQAILTLDQIAFYT